MAIAEPPKDCALCPRLVKFREAAARAEPGWYNGAVPSFGDDAARLLVVGLAPGLRGANRTGRPFTGDWAGDLLYATLDKFGLSRGQYAADVADGLSLSGAMITNSVRCVPPENKPAGTEINACRPFLAARIAALPNLEAILTLGKISHESTVRALGLRLADHRFAHNAAYKVAWQGRAISLHASYHCSRYNTNTGRLTAAMFEEVFEAARAAMQR